MKRLAVAALATGVALRVGVLEHIRDTIGAIKEGLRLALKWHQNRMLVDPVYPRTLLIVGRALVMTFIPSAIIGAAAITIISELLGGMSVDHDRNWSDSHWSDEDWGDAY